MHKPDELVHLEDFQAILNNPEQPYMPSEESQEIVRETPVALIVGPSSSGRNTTINHLMPTGDYYYMRSDTARQPQHRDGNMEQDGVEYWFINEDQFLAGLQDGAYVEAAVIHGIQVSGLSVQEVDTARKQGKVAISDVEISGVDKCLAIKPDTMALFFMTESLDEQLHRMDSRGGLTPETKIKRLKSAVKEYQHAIDNPVYWFVISGAVAETAEYVDQLVKTQQPDPEKQVAGRILAEKLLADTKAYLEENA